MIMERSKNLTSIPTRILRTSQLSISARYLYCILVSCCKTKNHCYLAQRAMCKILGMSERRIRTLLNELKRANLIKIFKDKPTNYNAYYICQYLVVNRETNPPTLSSRMPTNIRRPKFGRLRTVFEIVGYEPGDSLQETIDYLNRSHLIATNYNPTIRYVKKLEDKNVPHSSNQLEVL